VLCEFRDERLVHDLVLNATFPVLPEPNLTFALFLSEDWVLIESYLFLVLRLSGIFHRLVVVLGRRPTFSINMDFRIPEVGQKTKVI
jgi:hypothetical protein